MKELLSLNLGITTCYLLPIGRGYLLIDTGFPEDYRKFRRALTRAGLDMGEIQYLLLTHSHDDHVGFAARLQREIGVRLIVHKNAVPVLAQGRVDYSDLKALNRLVDVLGDLHGRFTGRSDSFEAVVPTDEDFILTGDETDLLFSLGLDAEILYTPGHSNDSISVIDAAGRAFCGDAAMNFLGFTGCRKRPIYYRDLESVFSSWQKILAREVQTLYPAHGKPFPAERLRQSLRRFAPGKSC